MSPELYAVIAAAVIAVLFVVVSIIVRLPKRLKTSSYERRWKDLQDQCSDKDKWPNAIKEADDLLNEALKKKKIKGTTMGERMVSAQKIFTNNDTVWFGHKLRMKLDATPDFPLKKDDVQKALLGLRQGLKDVGAL